MNKAKTDELVTTFFNEGASQYQDQLVVIEGSVVLPTFEC